MLKGEQKEAVLAEEEKSSWCSLKWLIHQLFVTAKESDQDLSSGTAVVICLIKSIMAEQISSREYGLSAVVLSFSRATLECICNCAFNV